MDRNQLKSKSAVRFLTQPRAMVGMTTAIALLGGWLGAGCLEQPKKSTPVYSVLPKKENVPTYLKDTIYEFTDISGTEPFPISGYGLVGNLDGTGGCRAPSAVRDYIYKNLARLGIGTVGNHLGSPEQVLDSKNFAIVRVDAFIPPGARASADPDNHPWNTWFDVRVSTLPGGDATSLAHGELYLTDLKVQGANPLDPGDTVEVKAQAAGAIFVNPAYALSDDQETIAARQSLRTGVVMSGARALQDRALILRLRTPEMRAASAMTRRINERFQDVNDPDLQTASDSAAKKVANAETEGAIFVYVPRMYGDDWQHFAGLVKCLYMHGTDAAFAALKAKELADAAVKPDAFLTEISYCWEGLGKPALYAIHPLLDHPNDDVRFAAARAAAYIGDISAVPVLLDIARTPNGKFQLPAVQVLAELPPSPITDQLVRGLLNSDNSEVRIEAYKLLAKHQDRSVITTWIKDRDRETFALDLIPGPGRPMVYATRQGLPRVAIFGNETQIATPMIFSALDHRLNIFAPADSETLSISYRSDNGREVSMDCTPDLAELAAKLGGAGSLPHNSFHFSYGDVVAILQALVNRHDVVGTYAGRTNEPAMFVIQDPGKVPAAIDTRVLARVPETGRPQTQPTTTDGTNPFFAPPPGLLREGH